MEEESCDDHEGEEYVERKGSQKGRVAEDDCGGSPGATVRCGVLAEEYDACHCADDVSRNCRCLSAVDSTTYPMKRSTSDRERR